MANSSLNVAKSSGSDEYYTIYEDIVNELSFYRQFLKGKVVYCNCDDPYESEFVRYFIRHFDDLGLKKLITTNYVSSEFRSRQTDLTGEIVGGTYKQKTPHKRKSYKVEITSVPDKDMTIDELVKVDGNSISEIRDGNFMSHETRPYLKEADVVVTNPPFSLFRDFISTMERNKKKYLVIGNVNAVTYKEVFPLFKDKKLWLGRTVPTDFTTPTGETVSMLRGLCRWFTNLGPHRAEPLELTEHYTPEKYPQFDNYDAINVNKVSEIPRDYYPTVIRVETKEELDELLADLDKKHIHYSVEEVK